MHSKKEIYILLLTFVLPVMLGTLFFYVNPEYFSKNTINYGTLIQPVITTARDDIVLETNEEITGQWNIAYWSGDNCDAVCNKGLEKVLTTRLLLNENMIRLQVVTFGENTNSSVQKANASSRLLQQLKEYPQNTVFVIDPIGNIMMYYDGNDIEVKKMLKDFKRLLKYSRIG